MMSLSELYAQVPAAAWFADERAYAAATLACDPFEVALDDVRSEQAPRSLGQAAAMVRHLLGAEDLPADG